MDILPGLRVDRFTRGARAYLLSHYHSDHMKGLSAGWRRGTIHATDVTCRLLEYDLGVSREFLRPVSVWEDFEAGGQLVTAMPANHCPGSAMFFARRKSEKGASASRPQSALYTGDFRLNDEIREGLAGIGPVGTLYVDSTYKEPHYAFPAQGEAIKRAVEIAREAPRDAEIMLGVYTIGKNRVVEAVSRALGEPVYVTDRVRRVYGILGLGEFVTGNRHATRLRAYARGYFDDYFFFLPRARREKAVVIIPTGWALDEPAGPLRRGGAEFHHVPYSEHCDCAERAETIRLVGAEKVVEI